MIAACANHAEREALGVCVQCHKLVCAECVTRVDGINYCVQCLERIGAERKSLEPEKTNPVTETISTLLLTAFLAASLWLVLLIVLPLRG